MQPVPDIIDYSPKVLFIGFNPSIRSSETGHHFAGPSNRFWRILHESVLTNEKRSPANNQKLLEYRFGITNIVLRPTRAAIDITKSEYNSGREALKQKLSKFQPRFACYVGLGVYQQFANLKNVRCGLQATSVVQGISDFVVSSSSGLNCIPLDQQLSFFIMLKRPCLYK